MQFCRWKLQKAKAILPFRKLSQYRALCVEFDGGAIGPDQPWWVVSGIAVSQAILLAVEHSVEQ